MAGGILPQWQSWKRRSCEEASFSVRTRKLTRRRAGWAGLRGVAEQKGGAGRTGQLPAPSSFRALGPGGGWAESDGRTPVQTSPTSFEPQGGCEMGFVRAGAELPGQPACRAALSRPVGLHRLLWAQVSQGLRKAVPLPCKPPVHWPGCKRPRSPAGQSWRSTEVGARRGGQPGTTPVPSWCRAVMCGMLGGGVGIDFYNVSGGKGRRDVHCVAPCERTRCKVKAVEGGNNVWGQVSDFNIYFNVIMKLL